MGQVDMHRQPPIIRTVYTATVRSDLQQLIERQLKTGTYDFEVGIVWPMVRYAGRTLQFEASPYGNPMILRQLPDTYGDGWNWDRRFLVNISDGVEICINEGDGEDE